MSMACLKQWMTLSLAPRLDVAGGLKMAFQFCCFLYFTYSGPPSLQWYPPLSLLSIFHLFFRNYFVKNNPALTFSPLKASIIILDK